MFEDSLFGGLDIASASDDPFALPVDSYYCTITGAVVAPTKNNPDKYGITYTYTVTDGSYRGQSISDWKEVPSPVSKMREENGSDWEPDKDYLQKLSFLKQRSISFGIPEDRINEVKASDLLGLDIVVTLGKSKSTKPDRAGKTVIINIHPASEGEVASLNVGTSSGNPFA
jgi:hypothetical protein